MTKAERYLSDLDPKIKELIGRYQVKYPAKKDQLFLDLVETIIGQQLSVKAAGTITLRFLSLFPDPRLTPQMILDMDTTVMRSKGVSTQKIGYLKSLAEHVQTNKLQLEKLDRLTDEEVIRALVAVKGIGVWTAEMFLLFSLARPDIFSMGDLGLRSAIAKIYGVDREDKNTILEITQKWKPFRSTASLYLWSSLDNQ